MKSQIILLILSLIFTIAISSNAQTKRRHRTKAEIAKDLKERVDGKFNASIINGDSHKFYTLLKRGADVNAKGFANSTPLMTASIYGRSEFLKVLIAKGAKINAKNDFGNTALMNAASFGQVEMVRDLLKAGADVNAKNESDWTALKLASKSAHAKDENFKQVVKLLKSYGANR